MAGSALRIDGEQDVLQLATRSGRYPVTMLCWARIVTDRNTYSAILTLEYGAGHSTEYNELVTDSDGTTLVVCDHGSLWSTVGTMTVGTWHKVAMVITAGNIKAYFGTEGTAGVAQTVSASIANITANDYQGVGSSNYASAEWFNGRLSGVRVWNAALTEAEIEAEFQYATPQRSADLLGAWLPPTVTAGTVLTAIAGADLVDGNGGGTPDYTIEDGPTLDAAPEPLTSLYVPGPGYRQPGRQCSCLTSFSPRPGAARTSRGSLLLEARPSDKFAAVAAAGMFGDPAPSSAGASVGSSTVTGVGAATASCVGSSSGSSTVAGTGSAAASAVGGSAGTSSASGVGAASISAVGSATGVGSASATGAATASAVGAAVGASSASATGAATASTVGGSSGLGTAAAAGSGTASAVGSSSGTSTALGVGDSAAVVATVGSSSGTSATSGVGSATAATVGASVGTGSATGAGAASSSATGASAGTSTSSATGAAVARSVGASSGISDATAIGAATARTVGASAGTSTATGISGALADAQCIGESAGSSTVLGVGSATALAVGVATGTSTAAATGAARASAAGSSVGASTAQATAQATAAESVSPVTIARFEASPNVARFVANANHPARFTAAPAVPHFIGSPIAA